MANITRAEDLHMIVVMGVTGAGKSYLINKLAGRQATREGETLEPCMTLSTVNSKKLTHV